MALVLVIAARVTLCHVRLSRVRFVLLGGLRFPILDSTDYAIPNLRRSDAIVVTDTTRYTFSSFLGDTGIPHRI